jgi:hypothetical protein
MRLRFTISGLMTVVVISAIVFAALRNEEAKFNVQLFM